VKYVVSVAGREIEVEVRGEEVTVAGRVHRATLSGVPGTPVRLLLLDEAPAALAVDARGAGRWLLTHRGERAELEVLDERAKHLRELAGAAEGAQGPAALRAPMPGLVVRVEVEPGQPVAAGAGAVVLEAMKMENELRVTGAGVVRTVRVRPGEAVEKGQLLVDFEAGS
jgi:biotin carboxyl carrier protein